MMDDSISRQAAIDAVYERIKQIGYDKDPLVLSIRQAVREVPSAQPEIVRCKECKWWDQKDDSPYGYCHAMKHAYYSSHWEIGIYRTYKADWFCADGELQTKGENDYDK